MGRSTFVLGKGGVGRTTVSRALALRSSADRSTVLVTTGTPPASERVTADLLVRRIDPRRLLDRAVQRVFPLGPLTRGLLKHPVYESLTEIAPALRELALLDAVDHMAGEGDHEVIVDGPATGHGLHFLEAPSKAVEVLAGRLKKRAQEIDANLHDADHVRVLVVTIPEELPVLESIELLDTLEQQGLGVPAVVVNRVPPPVPVEVDARYPTDVSGATPAQALTLLRGARDEAETWLERMRERHDNVVTVPFIPTVDAIEDDLAPFMEVLL